MAAATAVAEANFFVRGGGSGGGGLSKGLISSRDSFRSIKSHE